MVDAIDPYLANDKYRASLRSTWISSPADTTLAVNAIPDNVPTIVVAGWRTSLETVFTVTGVSGDSPSNYALTGVTRVRGANENLPAGTALNCINNEEFFNQYGQAINDVIEVANSVAIETVGILVVDPGVDVTTGDAKAFFRVPLRLNGMNLISVAVTVYTAGVTGNLDVQIRNKTDSQDMLSTKARVETAETDTSTSAQPGTVDTAHDDVATGDVIAIDVDAVQSGTAPKGLYVEMRFQTP